MIHAGRSSRRLVLYKEKVQVKQAWSSSFLSG